VSATSERHAGFPPTTRGGNHPKEKHRDNGKPIIRMMPRISRTACVAGRQSYADAAKSGLGGSRPGRLGKEGSLTMKLTYAVDRLYYTGWTPRDDADLERLPDGRRFPSVLAVQREFARAGLELSVKHNLVFNCFRSTWAPAGESLDPAHTADERHGTVIGACDREAAVYALAQLREAEAERQLTAV
jgi:hypothetical protein